MNIHDWIQILVYFAILLLLAKPLGTYMAGIYQGSASLSNRCWVPWSGS